MLAAWVVPALDVLEDRVWVSWQLAQEWRCSSVFTVAKLSADGVVEAVRDTARAHCDPRLVAAPTEGELRALIGVVHQPGGGSAVPDGQGEGLDHEFGREILAHRPAHDAGGG